jgi:hypothetical protein
MASGKVLEAGPTPQWNGNKKEERKIESDFKS